MIKLSVILLTFSNHTNKIKLTVKLDQKYYDMIFLYSSLIFISINNRKYTEKVNKYIQIILISIHY